MRCAIRVVAGAFAAAGVVADSAGASGPSNSPPQFDKPSYVITVDVSPPGPQSAVLDGVVTDADVADIVIVFATFGEQFMSFSSASGNPATFSLRADNLNPPLYGAYGATIVAFDGTTTVSVQATINVVPEPTALGVVAIATVWCRRR